MPVAKNILGHKFGPEDQITILERLPRDGRKSNVIRYKVSCSICAQDIEMYGDGVFETDISNLKAGKLPCGCSKVPKWTEAQLQLRLQRKAAESEGISFLGFSGEYKGILTRLLLCCSKHGEWGSAIASNFLHRGKGCPACRREVIEDSVRKSDDYMVNSFFEGNTFHKDTLFTRTEDRLVWQVYCPVCDSFCTGYGANLQRGHKPCSCVFKEQKYGYVNLVKDGDSVVAIKFGITGKSTATRCVEQNRKSIYVIENLLSWEFKDAQTARFCENYCKNNLVTHVLPQQEFMDGYTETTFTSNLDFIIDIFEKHGGKSI